MAERAQITVRGVVQGVGFRPYVFSLAVSLGLKGLVQNTPEGVLIDVEGDAVARFLERLTREAPPLASISEVSILPLPGIGHEGFKIIESAGTGGPAPFTLIPPDVALCPDCSRELLDPADRRYLYPFINCTNCGPRYSITKSVPYDRPNTTMASFQMCDACASEYSDPLNRRFHAQPNACPECGPSLTFVKGSGGPAVTGRDAMALVIEHLREGKTAAIKGLGGFHLACDALNHEAVDRLRERKRRSNKPFALMAPDVRSIERFCEVSDMERDLLLSVRRPIVLLKKKRAIMLPDAVSPCNDRIGFMLPYTPLHHLLFNYPVPAGRGAEGPLFQALVMTSGNLSEEPIVKDNDEAIRRLPGLADAFLLHDRDIFMRVDDSVLKVRHSGPGPDVKEPPVVFIRRSRGYAPEAVPLHGEGPEVLGCGADLKNTFTVTKGSFAIPSQHIGDMENYETLRFYEECLENISAVYRVNPVAIGYDLHPGYLSAQWARRKGDGGIKTMGIQHHYAHIASVMAEHGMRGPVIGVAFDGTGYGTDANLWGGEFLIAEIEGFERAGSLRYVPLPGGETAIREPWRTAVSYVFDAAGDEALDYLEDARFFGRHSREAVEAVLKVARTADLCPLSSGAGRLFDAVASLIGVCDRNTFEGEAAMALEAVAEDGIDDDYPVNLVAGKTVTVDFSPTVLGIISDCGEGVRAGIISAKFHNAVAGAILRTVMRISSITRINDVALSGGTFQNSYLLEKTVGMLRGSGMRVRLNKAVPCNDACISLGQAYLVRERLKGRA